MLSAGSDPFLRFLEASCFDANILPGVAAEFGIFVDEGLVRARSHQWWNSITSNPDGWPPFLESFRHKVVGMMRELLLLKMSKPTHFLFYDGNPTVELRISFTHDGLALVRRQLIEYGMPAQWTSRLCQADSCFSLR